MGNTSLISGKNMISNHCKKIKTNTKTIGVKSSGHKWVGMYFLIHTYKGSKMEAIKIGLNLTPVNVSNERSTSKKIINLMTSKNIYIQKSICNIMKDYF